MELIAVREVDHAAQGSRSAGDIEQLKNCHGRTSECVIEALSPHSELAR
jgi:hypothetical protein